MKKENKLSITDEMINVMRSIWSSRTKEQMDSCEKMLITFKEKHKDNLGTTLINIEMARQYRLCGLFAKMGKVQNALQQENKQKKKVSKEINKTSLN